MMKGNDEMGLLILAFAASLVPSILIFVRLKKLKLSDLNYSALCTEALKAGFFCTLPIVLTSMILNIIEVFIPFGNPVIKAAYHNFVVLALSEEANKYIALRRLLKKNPGDYSRLAVISFMVIVGIGFGLLEDIPYALGTNAVQMLVRGATIMHGIYGFILGLFVSDALVSKKTWYEAAGLVLVWMLHGLYDFTLKEEVLALSEAVMYIPVTLALISFVLVFVLLIFVHKAEKKEKYTSLMIHLN